MRIQAYNNKQEVKGRLALCDTAKQRDDAGLYISSLVLSQICLGISPGQLLDIKASPEYK